MPAEPLIDRRSISVIERKPWLALSLTLLVCLPLLLIDLTTRECTHTMENVAVLVSQETWLRLHQGDRGAWLMTYKDDRPRIEKPPMTTWLNFIAWADLTPETASPTQLINRARIVSVVLGMVLLASVFWMGQTLWDTRLAVTATLVVGSMFFFQRQARWGSYDIHYVAWMTASMAAGLWAIQPSGEPLSRGRKALGWGISAIALAFAILSKNPLPLAIVVIALGSTVVVMPSDGRRRWQTALWLVAAIAIACAISGSWYVYALNTVPSAAQRLRNETVQTRINPQVWYYYLVGLLGLVAPWTIWLIGGVVQPFTKEWRGDRRRLLIPWLWFAVILVFFSIPAAKQQRYILPIVPAAGLLIAHAWRRKDCADQATPAPEPLEVIARDVHWGALLIASLALGPFLALQGHLDMFAIGPWKGDAQRLSNASMFQPLSWPAAIALGAALTSVVFLGWRWHRHGRRHVAANITALWMFIVMAVWWHLWSATPTEVHAVRLEADRVSQIVGDAPVRRLHLDKLRLPDYKLDEQFSLYFGRLTPSIPPSQVGEYKRSVNGPAFVLARDEPAYTEALKSAGFVLVDDHVQPSERQTLQLWKTE